MREKLFKRINRNITDTTMEALKNIGTCRYNQAAQLIDELAETYESTLEMNNFNMYAKAYKAHKQEYDFKLKSTKSTLEILNYQNKIANDLYELLTLIAEAYFRA